MTTFGGHKILYVEFPPAMLVSMSRSFLDDFQEPYLSSFDWKSSRTPSRTPGMETATLAPGKDPYPPPAPASLDYLSADRSSDWWQTSERSGKHSYASVSHGPVRVQPPVASNSWRQPVAKPTAIIDADSERTHSDSGITCLRGQVLSALQRLDAVEAVDREQG